MYCILKICLGILEILGLSAFAEICIDVVIPTRFSASMYGLYAGSYEVAIPSRASVKILLEAMDFEKDVLNHYVALCGVNVVVPLEHPCWAREWCFRQGGEIKTCPWCLLPYHSTCIGESDCGCRLRLSNRFVKFGIIIHE